MPSRSFGDFRLKRAEMNFHNCDEELGYRPPIRQYTGPYITHKPEIREFELTKDDMYLVLASDGLWDNMRVTEVGALVRNDHANGNDLSRFLFNTALNRVSDEIGKSRDFISQLPPGEMKRSIVDDITILVVNLQGQVVSQK